MSLTIPRDELVRIVDSATPAEWSDARRARLAEVARTTTAVASGGYICEGVGCPLTQAGILGNPDEERFWGRFDSAVRRRYAGQVLPKFVVTVEPESESA